jgi:hypothetical protein
MSLALRPDFDTSNDSILEYHVTNTYVHFGLFAYKVMN